MKRLVTAAAIAATLAPGLAKAGAADVDTSTSYGSDVRVAVSVFNEVGTDVQNAIVYDWCKVGDRRPRLSDDGFKDYTDVTDHLVIAYRDSGFNDSVHKKIKAAFCKAVR
jgi:hypothetical protein